VCLALSCAVKRSHAHNPPMRCPFLALLSVLPSLLVMLVVLAFVGLFFGWFGVACAVLLLIGLVVVERQKAKGRQ